MWILDVNFIKFFIVSISDAKDEKKCQVEKISVTGYRCQTVGGKEKAYSAKSMGTRYDMTHNIYDTVLYNNIKYNYVESSWVVYCCAVDCSAEKLSGKVL